MGNGIELPTSSNLPFSLLHTVHFSRTFAYPQHTSSMAPSTTKTWVIQGQNGFDSLQFNEQAKLPELGDKDVLVKSMY